jgi:hypothetical protein
VKFVGSHAEYAYIDAWKVSRNILDAAISVMEAAPGLLDLSGSRR